MKTCIFLCFHINLKHESTLFHVNFAFGTFLVLVVPTGSGYHEIVYDLSKSSLLPLSLSPQPCGVSGVGGGRGSRTGGAAGRSEGHHQLHERLPRQQAGQSAVVVIPRSYRSHDSTVSLGTINEESVPIFPEFLATFRLLSSCCFWQLWQRKIDNLCSPSVCKYAWL